MATYAIGFGVYSIADSAIYMYIARVFNGIGSACMGISLYGIVTDSSKEENLSENFGRISATTSTGALYGVLVATVVFSQLSNSNANSWQILCIIYAVAALIALYFVITQVPETRVTTTIKKKKSIKLSPNAIKLLIITFFTSMSGAMLSPIVMIFLQDKFVNDLNAVGMAYIPSMIIASMFSSRVGKLGDRYGKVKAMIMGLIIGGVTIMVIPNMSTVILLAVILCVSCLGGLLSGPAEKGLFSEATSQESKGETYGIYSTIACLGGVVGPLLGGLLYDKVSPTISFYIDGVVCIIATGLVYVFFKNTVSKNTSETIAK